jgi:hypothetical protein
MTDIFKTIRAYLRGKWGNRGVANVMDVERFFAYKLLRENHARIVDEGRSGAGYLRTEIARLRRNKKKHSHLQKQLDDLISVRVDTDAD